jgi:hypothetical protein
MATKEVKNTLMIGNQTVEITTTLKVVDSEATTSTSDVSVTPATEGGPERVRVENALSFVVDKEKFSSYHSKVVGALEFYHSLNFDRKTHIIGRTNLIYRRTYEYFYNLIQDDWYLKDAEHIQLWRNMPASCRQFLNAMRIAKGKSAYYPLPSDNEYPADIVMVPTESTGHSYEANLPHRTSGKYRELIKWGSTERCQDDIEADSVRRPDYQEVLALVIQETIFAAFQ